MNRALAHPPLGQVRAVLFDLDGTLIDSAPDLAGAANDLRLRHGLPSLPYTELRPMVGSGARGMVGKAFGVGPGDESFEALKEAFLTRYQERSLQETATFPAVSVLLDQLDVAGMRWGIMTNKHTRFAAPIVEALGLAARAATVVCGDTAARAKPFPDPLLMCAGQLGLDPCDCIYVGDDLRDVQAGRAAGMRTVAVRWGYLGEGDDIDDWQADHVISQPSELLALLGLDRP